MDQNDVINKTGEEESQERPFSKMEALLAEEGLTIDFPKRGEIRKGTIASISEGQILVSVGAKSEGILAGKELDAIDDETRQSFNEGDEITVYVITPEDSNGNLILSFNRALEEENWQTAEELLESEESFTSKIEGYNKGGLLVPLGTIRGFVPASQIGLGRRLTITGNSPEERYSEMVNKEIEVCVIEVDRERRRLILSERAASSETRDTIKERVIEDLEEGEIRTGRVTSLADFGAFVNISGADGLVHLSEMSWEHINHPSEVLEVGQEIKVKVISVDPDRKRIGLSIRRLQDDPWDDQIASLTEGQLVEGKITRLTNFGAFARLLLDDVEGDLEGLIHISEISEQRIEHPKELLKDGDVLTLRIIKIEEDTHRIGLSMRRVDSPAYTDLDWKILTNEFDIDELTDDEPEDTSDIQAEEEADVESVEETAPEAQTEVEAETEIEVAAEAEVVEDEEIEPEAVEESVEDDTEDSTEETVEDDTEDSTEETVEDDIEDSTEESAEDDIEGSTEETVEDDTEVSTEETVEDDTEVSTEETVEDDTEVSTEETVEDDTEVSTEETVEDDTEVSTEETVEDDTEVSTEESVEDDTEVSTEETVEDDTEVSTEETVEDDTEDSTEETVEDDTEDSTEETVEDDTEDSAKD